MLGLFFLNQLYIFRLVDMVSLPDNHIGNDQRQHRNQHHSQPIHYGKVKYQISALRIAVFYVKEIHAENDQDVAGDIKKYGGSSRRNQLIVSGKDAIHVL